jgi:hypothetical protein
MDMSYSSNPVDLITGVIADKVGFFCGEKAGTNIKKIRIDTDVIIATIFFIYPPKKCIEKGQYT